MVAHNIEDIMYAYVNLKLISIVTFAQSISEHLRT